MNGRGVLVELPEGAFARACHIGTDRMLGSLTKQHKYGAKAEGNWDHHVLGAVGEATVAHYLGIPWDGALGDYKAKDVGPYQVRSTSYVSGKLPVHADADPDDRYFFVIVRYLPRLTLRIAGWILARHAQKERYWGALPGQNFQQFYVPQEELYHLELIGVTGGN